MTLGGMKVARSLLKRTIPCPTTPPERFVSGAAWAIEPAGEWFTRPDLGARVVKSNSMCVVARH
ncbi:hypothetical protein Isop_1576 [Isosphaera pallida ATCC 43644]|uniref:Uncharacterized protein n=1 Tax=Isosphaera pallida (strain ATCC 43644 / DSM 9630 / IS1B) TaxID=575540 RepID=E8QZM4_ISOPI|nr:hypothetical protein Isop_1576 [Isosphaera pallida ATCC 43644]